jgi:hypothetical protein
MRRVAEIRKDLHAGRDFCRAGLMPTEYHHKHRSKHWWAGYEGEANRMLRDIAGQSDEFGGALDFGRKNPMRRRRRNPHQSFTVRLHGRPIDLVFYDADMSAEDVKRSLINHDGYDPAITVTKSRRKYTKANPPRRRRKLTPGEARAFFDRMYQAREEAELRSPAGEAARRAHNERILAAMRARRKNPVEERFRRPGKNIRGISRYLDGRIRVAYSDGKSKLFRKNPLRRSFTRVRRSVTPQLIARRAGVPVGRILAIIGR